MPPKPSSQTILHFLLTCLLFSLLLSSTNSQNLLWHLCTTESNYTQGSQYQTNLNLTLTTLSSNITSSGFSTTTKGANPNTVYGLLQCRGDISDKDCRICANISALEITKQCPSAKEAGIFYDKCMLHYAGFHFFNSQQFSKTFSSPSPQNTTNPRLFSGQLDSLMKNLTSKAASDGSKFSTGSAPFNGSVNIYGLAQCTQDLSESKCLGCFQNLIEMISNCCSRSIGAVLLSLNCRIRYEPYLFFEESKVDRTRTNPTSSNPQEPKMDPTRTNPTSSNRQRKKRNMRNIVLIVISVIVASAICIYILWTKIAKRRVDMEEDAILNEDGITNTESEIETAESLRFDLATLRIATKDFSDAYKLGEGGFGSVYKGELPDGSEIAVKRLARKSGQGIKELKTEVVLVAKLMHRNLVRLLGFCLQEEEKLLIYEYLSNGSLDKILFDQNKRQLLQWDKRYNIIVGVARGLLYLHQDSKLRIIHRDLKPSNILLDEDLNAKISDFGLAKLFCEDKAQENTKRVVGTYGYMSPEYTTQGQYSTKSDAFSFGVIVLEIISGRRNSSFGNSMNLLSYAWHYWNEGKALQIVDPLLDNKWSQTEVIRCIQLGLLCVQQHASHRPDMAEVFLLLNSYSVTSRVPSRPAYFVERARNLEQSVNVLSVSDIHPRQG